MTFLPYIFLFVGNLYCQTCPCAISFQESGYVQRVKQLKKGIYFGNSVDSLPKFSVSKCNNTMYYDDCFYEYIYTHLPAFDSFNMPEKVADTVVRIGFIVKKDGSVSDAKIVHSTTLPSWDVACLSAVKKCPKFVSPAKKENIVVDYYCEVGFEDKRIY